MFCSAPWTHIFIRPDGVVKTCCTGQENLGNIKTNKIEKILLNPKYSSIKKDIIEGNWPKNCSLCFENEKLSGTSQRLSFQNNAIKKLVKENNDFFEPNFLDIRWNNTCNCSCVYCNEFFSSKWEKLKTSEYAKNEESSIDNFKSYLKNKKSSIKKLWLIGGEPLLIKDNLELLANTDDDVQLLLITNLSIPNLNKSPIWRVLKDKKNIKWNVSFENIGSKYEYVRHGANWNVLQDNLNLLLENNSDVTVAATYNILSAYNLDEFYEYCFQKNLKIQWSLLTMPPELNVYNFPYAYRLRAFNHINRIVEKYKDNELEKFSVKLLDNKKDDEKILMKFQKYINYIDTVLLKKIKFNFIFDDFYMH